MAKQRGIHQIKGKINNLCYYEQKYIRGGLIRRINEAMSERLKTDPAFERTRIANTIFGGCSAFARFMLSFFGSRNTFLFLPYRQAILTRIIQKYFVQYSNGLEYPEIKFRFGSNPNYALYFDEIVKNKLSLDFPEIPRLIEIYSDFPESNYFLSSESLENYLNKYGGLGVSIEISPVHYMYDVVYSSVEGKYFYFDGNPGGRGETYIWRPDEGDLELSFRNSTIDDAFVFWIIYISPIASQIGGRYIKKRTGATCGMIQRVLK